MSKVVRHCKQPFDVAFKLRVIHHAEASLKSVTAKEFNIHRKCVQASVRQKQDIQALTETVGRRDKEKKRLTGGRQKLAYPDLEDELFKWICDLRHLLCLFITEGI